MRESIEVTLGTDRALVVLKNATHRFAWARLAKTRFGLTRVRAGNAATRSIHENVARAHTKSCIARSGACTPIAPIAEHAVDRVRHTLRLRSQIARPIARRAYVAKAFLGA